jgi:phosphoribosyl-ATP pyrophosphohydrolase/phosphoribosyl-AMP cyclohydrolase
MAEMRHGQCDMIYEVAEMQLDFAKMDGLIPTVVQDAATKDILMVGFMNEQAWEKTRRTGHVTFWSRTRNTLWTKGESSGNFLVARRVRTDCHQDTLLIEAEPKGPTCHTGAYSCFFNDLPLDEAAPSGAGEGGRP